MKTHFVFQAFEDAEAHCCLRCKLQEGFGGTCTVAKKVVKLHGYWALRTWIRHDSMTNSCSFYVQDSSWKNIKPTKGYKTHD